MIPTSVFANNNAISIFSIGAGFDRISNRLDYVSGTNLPLHFQDAYGQLLNVLLEKGYHFKSKELVKLSVNCFAIPLNKTSLLGFKSHELALLVAHENNCNFYILNENTTAAFNSLIENFSKSSDSHALNLDVVAFSTPNEIISESHGKEAKFAYKNTEGNTITLIGSSKRQVAIVQ